MRLEIELPEHPKAGEQFNVRVILFNDSFEPVAVSRNAFVGPSLRALQPAGAPYPENVEATFGHEEDSLTLQPFCFYGRERVFSGLTAGSFDVVARYETAGNGEKLQASERLDVA